MAQQTVNDHLCWMVGGEAGYGVATMGQMFARACTRAGLNTFAYPEYPSLIRGGHNTAMVRAGAGTVASHSDKVDILLALNKDCIDFHLDKMAPGGVVIYDDESMDWDTSQLDPSIKLGKVPMARIVKALGANRIMKNTVALGASFALLNLDFKWVQSVLETTFARKGQEVVDFNVKVAKAGYEYLEQNFDDEFNKHIEAQPDAPRRMLMSGNDAIAFGAIKAGLKFMAAYPMTPVTTIMLTVARLGVKHKIIMKHTEDEIAAMNMTIGAAHMGVRAMTASAGGGFALMVEALGMAGITETPLVLVEGTRPGPSTGLPTWTDQGDLRFVMHASQGEFPRMIYLPGDVNESFHMTLKAFNLAEKYQMICIILTDKYLEESVASTEPFKHEDYVVDRGQLLTMDEAAAMKPGEYKRFEFTESGVSKRAVPGMPNTIYAVSTDEHQESGDLDESSENRIKMVNKRAKKFDTMVRESFTELEMMEVYGPENADLTLVGWGSTKNSILEAIDVANTGGKSVNFLQIKTAFPFASEGIARVLNAAKKTVMIENNAHAQMAGVIRENTGILIEDKLLKYDGRPFNPAEILDKINSSL